MVVKSVLTHLPMPPALCDSSLLSLAREHSWPSPGGSQGQEAVCSNPTVCLKKMARREGKKEEVLQIPLGSCSRSSTAPRGISQHCPSKHSDQAGQCEEGEIKLTHKQEEREGMFIPFWGDANSLSIKTKKINIMG